MVGCLGRWERAVQAPALTGTLLTKEDPGGVWSPGSRPDGWGGGVGNWV